MQGDSESFDGDFFVEHWLQRLTIWPVRDCGLFSYQCTRKVEAGYKPSHTNETLIGYIVCCQPYVCPAMNQGTFKYRKLSVNQEERSLKLIHHNFK